VTLTLFAGGATASAATKKADQVAVRMVSVAKYGKVLVDQKGLALYYDNANKPPHFACKGACLVVWPPLLLPKGQAKPIAAKGVTGLGVVKGPSGEQVAWHGKPLYTFIRDSKGTVRGQGLKQDGTWFVVQATKSAGPPTSTWA
jgi:predicted lipoprotein with Yx(FWY)xxD motif